MNLEQKIEAVLFYKAEPISIEKLSQALEENKENIKIAIGSLKENLKERGIVLVQNSEKITLATHPKLSSTIEKLAHEEVSGPLTKSTLETLSIITYEGPVTKVKIDYIRGVNSQFILRNLLIRGLIEKDPNPKDARTYLYKPSFKLLSYLGITTIDELPNYKNFKESVAQLEEEQNNYKQENNSSNNNES